MDHTSTEPMRAYLLGLLSEHEAAALEEEYFVNRAVFLKAQSVEMGLIAEYLDGALQPAEKQCFENRYLRIPELQRKVEEVRRQRGALRPAPKRSVQPGWRMAFVGALVLIVGLGIWAYRVRLRDQSRSVAGNQGQPNLATPGQFHTNPDKRIRSLSAAELAAAVYMSPGLTKGSGSKPVELQQPAAGVAIHLLLELPGQVAPVHSSLRISIVKPDGHWETVLDRPDVLSESIGGGQALLLPLSGQAAAPGDYVIEAKVANSAIHETYTYRITAPR